MNIAEFANEAEKETDRLNKRLYNIIDSLRGPVPEKSQPRPPRESGTIGTLREIGLKLMDAHDFLVQLEGYLCDSKLPPPSGSSAIGISHYPKDTNIGLAGGIVKIDEQAKYQSQPRYF